MSSVETTGLHEELVPLEEEIYGWIADVFAQGVRRPGYATDRWTEGFCREKFETFGLQDVRLDPVDVLRWEPRRWSLVISCGSDSINVPCFPVPYSMATKGLEAEVANLESDASPRSLAGKIAVYDLALQQIPYSLFQQLATWYYDPGDTFSGKSHVVPFSTDFQEVMEPAIGAGAVGFIGVLSGYTFESHDYYVPYDGVQRPIPGVWVSSANGERVRQMMANGPARARIEVDSVTEQVATHNVLGFLPGGTEELVVIGSHHDGPWASAVEDASGVALLLAQAKYWGSVPREERPFSMIFLATSAHMAGGRGTLAFIDNSGLMDRIVLEMHLEHAAREHRGEKGQLVPTGEPEARWWFTTRIPELEAAVRSAIEAEDLCRSLVLPASGLRGRPPTDGGQFNLVGVPLVNYLTAPLYLFDSQDTMDKIDREGLVPVTRAAIRIINSMRGSTAEGLRSHRLAETGPDMEDLVQR